MEGGISAMIAVLLSSLLSLSLHLRHYQRKGRLLMISKIELRIVNLKEQAEKKNAERRMESTYEARSRYLAGEINAMHEEVKFLEGLKAFILS
jgi:hypothetical protein